MFASSALGFLIFFIAALAETNRVPFDLPEAETELVAGYHTEYSSMKFAMFFMAEYANMITAARRGDGALLRRLERAGGRLRVSGAQASCCFLVKVCFFLFIYIWIRFSLPRFRYDQLMEFGWKLLLPLALFNIVITATIMFLACDLTGLRNDRKGSILSSAAIAVARP